IVLGGQLDAGDDPKIRAGRSLERLSPPIDRVVVRAGDPFQPAFACERTVLRRRRRAVGEGRMRVEVVPGHGRQGWQTREPTVIVLAPGLRAAAWDTRLWTHRS